MKKWKSAAQALALGRQLIAPALETTAGATHSLLHSTQRGIPKAAATGAWSDLFPSAGSGQGLRAACSLASGQSDERECRNASRNCSTGSRGVHLFMPLHSAATQNREYRSSGKAGYRSMAANDSDSQNPAATGTNPSSNSSGRGPTRGGMNGGEGGRLAEDPSKPAAVELSDQALPDEEILKTLAGYLLSGEQPGFRRRIGIAMGLLVASKALTIQVSNRSREKSSISLASREICIRNCNIYFGIESDHQLKPLNIRTCSCQHL